MGVSKYMKGNPIKHPLKKINKNQHHFHVCEGFAYTTYVCPLNVCSARRGQKAVLDPLELEFQMVVSHCVGVES